MDSVLTMAMAAREASCVLRQTTADARKAALQAIASALRARRDEVRKANQRDLAAAQEADLAPVLRDRLDLNEARFESMVQGVEAIANQPEVVGAIVHEHTRDDGLVIQKQRVPLGVIAMIFESRPNVVCDCAALAIKSGNAIVLKGGKEAAYSNAALAGIVQDAIAPCLPRAAVTLLDSKDRAGVQELLQLQEQIDVVIPRGGEGLIRFVYEHATMPVIAHFRGLCHVFVDADCDPQQALKICVNAKAQRPGVCNAAETILVHRDLSTDWLPALAEALRDQGVEVRGCERTCAVVSDCRPATDADWDTEYLDAIVSLRVVDGLTEAIDHIARHGTFHTEVICTRNQEHAARFCQAVDASCVVVNASSRFNDGGQLGIGAELGISTTKFHAYGPMGAAEMTTTRYCVRGTGHIRDV